MTERTRTSQELRAAGVPVDQWTDAELQAALLAVTKREAKARDGSSRGNRSAANAAQLAERIGAEIRRRAGR